MRAPSRGRYLLVGAALLALSSTQASAEPFIEGFTVVSSKRLGRTTFAYDFNATLRNDGPPASGCSARLTAAGAGTGVDDGHLTFGAVAAGELATSEDTFTVIHNRRRPFDRDALVFEVECHVAPVADAGPDQSVRLGETVVLDGSGSSGGGVLRFDWRVLDRPAGSQVMLSDPTSVAPTFVVDVAGEYLVELVVSVGSAFGAPDRITVVAADGDRDGDGVPDEQDTYPDDPDRSKLPAVAALQAGLDSMAVRLAWQPIPEPEHLAGYHVFRAAAGTDAFVQITDSPVEAITYTDSDVSNGAGYVYQLAGVDDRGNEGLRSEDAPFFVVYNHTATGELAAAREGVRARVSWAAVAGFRYRLFRSSTQDPPAYLADLDVREFLDAGAHWAAAHRYQVATLADFVDPFTGAPVAIAGPRSAPAEIPALPPLGLVVDNATPTASAGVELLVVPGQETVTLVGTTVDAVGTVDLTATSGAQTLRVTAAEPGFRLALPVGGPGAWTITAVERVAADRRATIEIGLVRDQTAPVVSVDGAPARSVDADIVIVSGSASDQQTGVAEVSIASDRYPGQRFGVVRQAGGAFYGEVPLEHGTNQLVVTAIDEAGNQGEASVEVSRPVPAAPVVTITAPADRSTVDTDTVDLTGTVYTSLPAEQVRVLLGNRQQFPAPGGGDGYPFAFPAVALIGGENELMVRVETPAGVAEASVTVAYRDTPPDPVEKPPPVIDITHPRPQQVVADSAVTVAGTVSSAGGAVTLTVQGEPVQLMGQDATGGTFRHQLDLSGDPSAEVLIALRAVDAAGGVTEEIITVQRDATPPVLDVTTPGLQPAPVVNRVIESPFPLAGSVRDASFAGLSVNGQAVGVVPAAEQGTYTFAVGIELPPEVDRLVVLEAWDRAGNRTSREIVLHAAYPVSVELIAPRDGVELLASSDTADLRVVARVAGLPEGATVTAAVDYGDPLTLALDGPVATGAVPVTVTPGLHEVAVEVTDEGGPIVQARAQFSFVRTDELPLELDRHEPENAEAGVEPNAFVALYFNKPIDPDLLHVDVRETVHGLAYDLSAQHGADFTTSNQVQLVEVHAEMEPVPGGIARLPGNRTFAFHPARDFHYDADVFVDVEYDGEPLRRFNFEIRPLPTLVQGFVADQLRRPIVGIEVAIPDLGRTATTDGNGNFGLGFGDRADEALPGGRYRMLLNPGMDDHAYGTLERWVNIEEGRLTQLGMTRLPLLNPIVPFRRIASGQAQARLAEGDLILDLSDAVLEFADGRDRGDVHVQFLELGELSFPTLPSAIPHWVFGVQPGGVRMSGAVGVTIAMPPLFGSYAYVPPNGTRVVMVGFDEHTKHIVPVGVGRIENRRVVSVGGLSLSTLDYIGYAFVGRDDQAMLMEFETGSIEIAQLIARLEAGR